MSAKFFRIATQHVYIGGMLGLTFFLLVFGVAILDPQNITWLLQQTNQDSVQHLVGWEFFRNESWDFPLGIIHNYGFPISTSIVYTDSIPIFALIFKCFSAYLPVYFQYFGLWYAVCYFLQGMFGWLISEKISNHLWIKIIITCFFLLSPIMLNRTLEHQALVAQWVLLAGFLLYLQPYRQRMQYDWLALNVITVLIHAYLAVMVLLIWCAFLYKNVFMEHSLGKKSALRQILMNIMALLLTGWIAGYFVISLSQGIEAGGYSLDSMNLLAPFIPSRGSPIAAGNWSRFFTKSFPMLSVAQEDEGFNYFGLGMLLLIVVSIYYLIKKWLLPGQVLLQTRLIRRSENKSSLWLPLIVMCSILGVYALSNEIAFGPILLAHYPLPSIMLIVADIFRASGRFFWPVYYFVMVSVFYFLQQRLNKTVLITLFSIALIIQLTDLSGKLSQLNQHFKQVQTSSYELNSPFWNKAVTRYTKLVFLPGMKQPQAKIVNFQNYIHYAALHHMKVNLGYFAREDTKKFAIENRQLLISAMQGKFAGDSIYIITKPHIAAVLQNRANTTDKKERIGRYLLIAPGWNSIARRYK